MDSNATDWLQQGVIFQQDHVSLHKAHQTTQKIAEMRYVVLTYLLYSPDLAPSDFHLFGPLKESHKGGINFENRIARVLSEILPKTFWSLFSGHTVKQWQPCCMALSS